MTLRFRTDAPGACGCPIVWTDSPSGPKAQPCACGAEEGGRLDRALAKSAEELRQAGRAGPPPGAMTKGSGPAHGAYPPDPPGRKDSDDPLGDALRRTAEDARKAAQAGPPPGAKHVK